MATIQGQISTANSATTVLSVSTGQILEIFQIELHSVRDQVQIVQIYFVPNSGGSTGTAALSNEKESISLAAGASLALVAPKAPWKLSSQGDSIQLKTNANNVLNYWITYAINGEL